MARSTDSEGAFPGGIGPGSSKTVPGNKRFLGIIVSQEKSPIYSCGAALPGGDRSQESAQVHNFKEGASGEKITPGRKLHCTLIARSTAPKEAVPGRKKSPRRRIELRNQSSLPPQRTSRTSQTPPSQTLRASNGSRLTKASTSQRSRRSSAAREPGKPRAGITSQQGS